MSQPAKKKKMGRPPKPEGQAVLVAGRVPPATAAKLAAFAKSQKITQSEALRRVIEASMVLQAVKPPAARRPVGPKRPA